MYWYSYTDLQTTSTLYFTSGISGLYMHCVSNYLQLQLPWHCQLMWYMYVHLSSPFCRWRFETRSKSLNFHLHRCKVIPDFRRINLYLYWEKNLWSKCDWSHFRFCYFRFYNSYSLIGNDTSWEDLNSEKLAERSPLYLRAVICHMVLFHIILFAA